MVWKAEKGDPYALLAALLAEERGIEALPTVARTERGKPYFPDWPHLHFSVSRSGDLSLCALGTEPVGADIERVRARSAGLPRYALGKGEYEWFRSRGSRWEDFYTLWTLKEAKVKCTGAGIFQIPAREVAVPLIGPGGTAKREGFFFAALRGEGWRGGICLKIL